MGLIPEPVWFTGIHLVLSRAPSSDLSHFIKYLDTYIIGTSIMGKGTKRDGDCFGQWQKESSGRSSQSPGEMARRIRVFSVSEFGSLVPT